MNARTASPAQTAAVAAHVDPIVAKLDDLKNELYALCSQLVDAETGLQQLGTGQAAVFDAVRAARIAHDHAASAWRSVDYSLRNLTDR